MSINRPTPELRPARVAPRGRAGDTETLSQADVVARLRAETAACHQRLEARSAVLERAASPDRRGGLVLAFHRLHSAADAGLAPLLAGSPGLDYRRRRRLPLLRADLASLRVRPGPRPAPPSPTCQAEAMGMLYVLEGSTLGAQVIRRDLARAGADFRGLSFLDPYGAETGAMWRSFLAVLTRTAGEQADGAAAAVRGGLAGFALAERLLAPAEALA